MKLPRTAILLLRGLEGCGVTQYARHTKAYFDDKGVDCDIYVLRPAKKTGRPDTSTDLEVRYFDWAERDDVVGMINANYDLALIYSAPAINTFEEVQTKYVDELIRPIAIRKVLANHDHSQMSSTRNADYQRCIEACDVVLCHSLEYAPKGFLHWSRKRGIDEGNYDKLDVFFHVPFVEDLITYGKEGRVKQAICAGRFSSWKRSNLMFQMHPLLRDAGFSTYMIGYERSVAASETLKHYDGLLEYATTPLLPDGRQFTRPSRYPQAKYAESGIRYWMEQGYDPDKLYVVGPYNYLTGMELISKAAFAIHPRTFGGRIGLSYGNNMEYQTLEACLLSAPVLHRHFAETATIPGTDKTLASTGIFPLLDDDYVDVKPRGQTLLDGEKVVAEMTDIWENRYEETRKASVELIRDHYSAEVMVPKMIERCRL